MTRRVIDRRRITVYGTQWCADCRRAKKLLDEQGVSYSWVDVDQDSFGMRYIEKINGGKSIVPTIVFGDGSILVEPSNSELLQKLE